MGFRGSVKSPGLCLVMLLCILAPGLAQADVDGNQLLKECISAVKVADGAGDQLQSDDLINAIQCTGFIEGYHAANRLLDTIPGNKAYYCLPADDVPPEQSARVLVNWLKANPEYLNQPASYLMTYAFSNVYPCKIQPTPGKESQSQPKQVL
jgi:hypothetical protein